MPPLTLQQAFELAKSKHHAGQLKAAEELYRQILAHDPKHAHAAHLLGLLSHQTGQSPAAVELIQKSISLGLNSPDVFGNLGNALRGAGRLDDAITAFNRSLALEPRLAATWINLGNTLRSKGIIDDAIAAFRRALELEPALPEGWNSLSVALVSRKRFDEAIAASRQAISLRATYIDANINLANGLKYSGQLDEAIAVYRHAITLNPNVPEVHSNLGGTLKEAGRADEALTAFRRAAHLNGSDPKLGSNLILLMHYHPACDARSIADECARWNVKHAQPLAKMIRAHDNNRDLNRQLKIGYVSPDFRDHVVGRNILPLLARHDRHRFHVTCYSSCGPDEMTRRFQLLSDSWRETADVSDDQLADQIRSDRIDILVDLALHTAGNRLLVFARKPAPVQVSFAGYPGSTGLTTIDYRLSDPYLDPPGMDDSMSRSSEKIVRLEHTFWCYDPLDCADISTGQLPALENKFITFGCLNNFSKINDDMLALWARVLMRTANSRLLLLSPPGKARSHTLEIIQKSGINRQRVEFVSNLPRRDYLMTYRGIDIALDTFPYNGHTTSLDALWMGVPVVTCVGSTAVARAGWSQLSNLGLTELTATTSDQFVAIANALANDLPRLSHLRTTLRQRMEQSALMQSKRWTLAIENTYQNIWRDWCEA